MLKPGHILALALAIIPAARAADGEARQLQFIAPGGNEVVPAARIDLPPAPLQTDIEWPSADMYRRGEGGSVVLRLVIDDKGMPAGVSDERAWGVEAADLFAAIAATKWRFTPARYKGRAVASEARQPVEFEIPPEYALTRTTGRARDGWFEQRRGGAAERPVADAAGQIPGYLADPLPIGVASIAEARQMLERHGYRSAPGTLPMVTYALRDEEGYSEWAVMPALPGGVSMLVRSRLVGDATSTWMVQSLLCEGAQQACADMRERFARGTPPQRFGGPYPLPPAAVAPASMR